MILINHLFLKNKNGMYYYSNDYVSCLNHSGVETKVIGDCFSGKSFFYKFKCFLEIYYLAFLRGFFVYTPTIHPLPFINRQLVVCHDSYPFLGVKGIIKKTILKLSLYTSRCAVGYINMTDSKFFVDSLRISDSRKIFLPNLINANDQLAMWTQKKKGIIDVALVGTDSNKKRYHVLFDLLLVANPEKFGSLIFHLYGGDNAYRKSLFDKYSSDIKLQWVNSSEMGMDEFISNSDVLISIAKNEGFGRPIAFALQRGLPVLLIDDPVFREFFSDSAYIFDSEVNLIDSIHKILETHQPMNFPTKKIANEMSKAKNRFLFLCK